jgi:anti-sigma regulatory factor (Ser/Thr protein kinase)
MVRLARLVASGVAASAGFGVDEVEDVRIGVAELCAALIEAGGPGPLHLVFARDGTGIEISGTAPADTGQVDPRRLGLSREILSRVVDDHTLAFDRGQVAFWIRKGGRVG